MTYDKRVAQAAATKTVQALSAERQKLVMEWDAKSAIVRFLREASPQPGNVRPDHYGVRAQIIAERVSFKAAYCTESTMALTDEEIDVIKNYWGL